MKRRYVVMMRSTAVPWKGADPLGPYEMGRYFTKSGAFRAARRYRYLNDRATLRNGFNGAGWHWTVELSNDGEVNE